MKKSKIFGIAAVLTATTLSVGVLSACGGGGNSVDGIRNDLENRTDKYGNTLVTIMVHKDQSTKEDRKSVV